jgi:hypothetical protein
MIDPDIKQNPHPVKRYEITMTIDGAPGPFDSIEGHMQFDISNPLCAPQDPVSGARPTPIERPPIVFTRVSGETYKGTVYLDLIQDDDYYGLGICHWSMTAAVVSLNVHGLSFSSNASADEIVTQKAKLQYFDKASYLDKVSKDYSDAGIAITDYITQHPDEFFSVKMTGKEIIL